MKPERSSVYVNEWDEVHNRSTVMVSDEPKSFRVVYRDDNGSAFRVNVVQRANPIGFTAKIPGDRRA